MSGSIKQCFLNVNMSNRFDGLQTIAKKGGIDLLELSAGDYLVFVNASRDKVALLVGSQTPGGKQTMVYERMKKGQRLDMKAIREIPRAFDGKKLNLDVATGLALDKALGKKAGKIIEAAL